MVDRNVIFCFGTSIQECGYESFDGKKEVRRLLMKSVCKQVQHKIV
jgi:hypothetical protein